MSAPQAQEKLAEERAVCSDDEDEEEDADWDDWGEEGFGDDDATKSLFCDKVLKSPEDAMAYDRDNFGFDLRVYSKQANLKEYDLIKFVTFVRTEVAASRDPLPLLKSALEQQAGAQRPWSDDKYLQPVAGDDPLLFYDVDGDGPPIDTEPSTSTGGGGTAEAANMTSQLSMLTLENEALREALKLVAALPDEVVEQVKEEEKSMSRRQPCTVDGVGPSGSKDDADKPGLMKEVDQQYFDSYNYFDIHREMISDRARTDAYRDALECNPALIKGATVLDVGCGTGILSMFACRAGAKRVISVDGGERIAGFAKRICELNGFSHAKGGPMSVVVGKIEELKELPVDKVDVIVSEWMGYALLFETMLDSVIYARDKWLRPGGTVLPDKAIIHLGGVTEAASGLGFWRDVYGFSMEPIRESIAASHLKEAVVRVVPGEALVTEPFAVKEWDLCTMTAEEADFTASFELCVKQGTAAAKGACAGVLVWFDVDFSARCCTDKAVKLTTSPTAVPTHWAQTLLSFEQPIDLVPTDSKRVKAIAGTFSMARGKQHRQMELALEYYPVFDDEAEGKHEVAMFKMAVSSG